MALRRWHLQSGTAALCLSVLTAGCGGGGGGGGPDPTPTPVLAKTRVEVLRDQALPRLSVTVDGAGGPTFLVGQRVPNDFGGGDEQIAKIDTSTCTVTARWQNLDAYLDAAKANKINLLHVELWSVWTAGAQFPYLKDAAGKFRVQAAVENNQWNEQYFQGFRELVQKASARGIVLYVSLFNHYNIRWPDKDPNGLPWSADPFRASNTDTSFGLDDYGGNSKLRTAAFLRFKDGSGSLTTVARIQKALVERLLEEVTEQNVIFEPLMVPWVFNNPDISRLGLPAWENWVIATIRAKESSLGRGLKTLIALTPAPLSADGLIVGGGVFKDFDIADWKNAYRNGSAGFENWSQVDIIAYAGGFAFFEPPFGNDSAVYLHERLLAHQRFFPEKLALFNSDGFNQRYAPDICTAKLGMIVQDVRHGWWKQVVSGVDLSQYPLFWARKTRDQVGTVPLGYVHFMNWTTAQSSMEDLGGGNL
jgi:hypothetical protein